VTWEPGRQADVVRSYRLQHELSQGSDGDRRIADRDHWWAWDAVHLAVRDGDLPVEVIDAMLHDPEADDWHRAYVAAGPIEDLLSDYADEYEDAIADRCRTDSVWARTVEHVWLEREDWEQLPDILRRLIPGPAQSGRSSGSGRRGGRPPGATNRRR
jgi:hypothetical protein